MRALLLLAVVNTVLFTVVKVGGLSIWWVVALELAAFLVWLFVKSWFHPAQQLVNQAARMNWIAAGMVRDESGFRDAVLEKDGIVARISYQRKHVEIIEPEPVGPFRDFVEVDRFVRPWLGGRGPIAPEA